MSADEVEVGGKRLAVRDRSSRHLTRVRFMTGGRQCVAIELNPAKPCR